MTLSNIKVFMYDSLQWRTHLHIETAFHKTNHNANGTEIAMRFNTSFPYSDRVFRRARFGSDTRSSSTVFMKQQQGITFCCVFLHENRTNAVCSGMARHARTCTPVALLVLGKTSIICLRSSWGVCASGQQFKYGIWLMRKLPYRSEWTTERRGHGETVD